MTSPLVKSLKTVKSMSGSASSLAEIKRHRKQADLASRLATPKGNVERKGFRVGKIRCEEFTPNHSYDPDYVILYCHGGGYISGGLDYSGNLAVKLAMATGFSQAPSYSGEEQLQMSSKGGSICKNIRSMEQIKSDNGMYHIAAKREKEIKEKEYNILL